MAKVITVTVPPAPVEVIQLSVDPSPVQVIQLMIPGQQGPTGLPGPQGAPGSSNVLSIGTVTTGAVGSNASATISGVSPNQTLNLTIPRGNTGATGATPALSIGTINTLAEGQAANATITGTTAAPILNLGIPRGYGVRAGGATGDVLTKLSATDHDTGWVGATPFNTASTLVKRHTDGGIVVQYAKADSAPASVDALTRKDYVDNLTKTSLQISDATATGRSVLTAADAAAARTAIGAGTSSLVLGTTVTTAKAGNYQPTAANISDSTATGRAVLTAADAAAARTAIGAGTSSLVIGTTATTAKAGNYQPAAADISDSTATGRSLITAASATAARTTIGLPDEYTRDRGSGTTLPATDLRGGDVYKHNTLGLHIYDGTSWRILDTLNGALEGGVVFAYGHSYVAADFFGQGDEQRYILRAGDRLDFGIINRAVGGYQMKDVILDASGTRFPWRKWDVGATGAIVLDCTINNVNVHGATTQALADYRHSLRSFLEFASLGSIINDDASGWTYNAGATQISHVDGYGGTYRFFASGQVATAQRTFTGTEVTVSINGHNGAAGALEILIDGVVRDTVTTANQATNGSAVGGPVRDFVPMARRITGLTNASHTLLIRSAGGAAMNGNAYLDYVGFRSANPPPIFVIKCVDIIDTSKDTAIDAYNTVIDEVAAEYPNVYVVDATVGWDRATMIGPDNLHLSARGNSHVASALVQTMGRVDFGVWVNSGGYLIPRMTESVREVVEITAFHAGYSHWADNNYDPLTFYLHRDGMVTATGVWNAGGANPTHSICTLTGPYRPRNGRSQVVNGGHSDALRLYDIAANGLVVRGAVPTTGWMSINCTYPGWYVQNQ